MMGIQNTVDDWTAWTGKHELRIVRPPRGTSVWEWEWVFHGVASRQVGGESASEDCARREGVRSITKHLRKRAQELLDEEAEFEKLLPEREERR